MKNYISKFLILLGILFIQSKVTEANWRTVQTVSTRLIWNITYADNNTVYAVGDSLLMKSNDGGESWIDLLPNIASLTSDKKFFNLSFLNEDTGFVFRNTTSENLFRTTDGGATWSDVSPSVLPMGMLDVHFVNQSVGYAVGGFSFLGDSTIARTNDGGLTWTNVSGPILSESPMAVYFLTDSIGFTGDDEIYKTTDAGTTWTLASTPSGWIYNDRVTDYKFFDNQTGFAITDNWHMYQTTDGGLTWQFLQLPVSGANGCRSIAFDQNNFGYVVGFGLPQPFISTDAGNSWVIDGTFSPYYLQTCVASSADHKIIIGTRKGNVVLRNHGPLSSSSVSDLDATSIYPNPTTGKFYIVTNQKIKTIDVYNLLGASVYSQSEMRTTDRYEINLTDLPKGLYIIKIRDGTNSVQRKVRVE